MGYSLRNKKWEKTMLSGGHRVQRCGGIRIFSDNPGTELMSQDEIAVMDGAKCILQLRGVIPFLSDKYDITKHPKYRQLFDYDMS